MYSDWIRQATFLAVLAAGASAQTTWYVDLAGVPPGTGTDLDPYTSLQYAIDQTSTLPGDSLVVAPGTYLEQIDYGGKSLDVSSSAGAELTVLDAAGAGSVVTFSGGEGPGTRLAGFGLRNGIGALETGLRRGGAIRATNATVLVEDCRIQDCRADEGGAICVDLSDFELRGCTLVDIPCGGGIYAGSMPRLELADCTLENLTYDGCSTMGHEQPALHASLSSVIVSGTSFLANKALSFDVDPTHASAVVLEQCTATFESCLFQDNGIDPAHLFDVGGAMAVIGGSLAIRGSQFLDNDNETRGGAIALRGGDLHVEDSLFADNDSIDQYVGGAIYVSDLALSTVLIERTSFLRNEGGDGGAVYVGAGTVDFAECLFADNAVMALYTETGSGGALYVEPAASVGAVHCTFLRNEAFGNVFLNPVEGHGGATAGPMLLDRCTLLGNQAFGDFTSGRGGACFDSIARSSIVRKNQPDQLDGLASAEWSNVQDGYAGTGNIDADPLFWDETGGDYHLLGGSPCIDSGDPAVFDEDGSRADMGAFPFTSEHCAPARSYCTAKLNSQGCLPQISSSGAPNYSGVDDFHVLATQVINKQNGMLIWSHGPKSIPFFGGTLCLESPIVRTTIQNSGGNTTGSDCSGQYDYHFSQAYMQSKALLPYDSVYAQYWYRDPMGTFGVGLTDALRFVICTGD